jgi:hypothetical protein
VAVVGLAHMDGIEERWRAAQEQGDASDVVGTDG